MKKLLLSITALMTVSALARAGVTVTDACGNTYPVVRIGTQIWMSENLKCNKYDTKSESYNALWLTNNTIPTSNDMVYTPYYTDATDRNKWRVIKYVVNYAGNLTDEQVAKLGYLYNWAAAVGVENGQTYGTTPFTGDRQGICPNGWHIPSYDEWQTLANYIDGNNGYTDTGKKIKTTSGWYKNGSGTDSYRFAALPSGLANGNCVGNAGYYTHFWTATPSVSDSDEAYSRYLLYDYDYLFSSSNSKHSCLNVRCLKNDEEKKPEKCKASDYPQVTIGTQTWMAENYACSKYDTESEAYNASWLTNNTIPTTVDKKGYAPYYTDATDQTYWVETDYSGNLSSEQIAKLGYLYNWAAAVGVENGKDYGKTPFSGNRQGICPNGWHVPTKAEWQTLANYIDGNNGQTDAGKKMKTTSGWYRNGNGTDNYGFAVLPSGYTYGGIHYVGSNAYFWTATPSDSGYACYRSLGSSNDYLDEGNFDAKSGRIVRCVKNASTSATEAEADSTPSVSKQLIDGQIVIVKGDKKYNLQGVEIK